MTFYVNGLADDLHEIASLIFSEKIKQKGIEMAIFCSCEWHIQGQGQEMQITSDYEFSYFQPKYTDIFSIFYIHVLIRHDDSNEYLQHTFL